ncbi:MAG: TVP38/TMEM64 family protein [Erysipelotrichia bacterium]|nr:TVP38/TMEM64 family protein [Erysipelotrichia bacterium]NCC55000.1 TVP38/TMEM64 family protein [Erysipelotrichia bacterium]
MDFIKKNKKMICVIVGSIVVMGMVCLFLYEPMMNFLQSPKQLKAYLQGYGIFGYLILLLVMSLQVVFVFLPGEIVEVMAGFVYGSISGMFLCLLGAALGSAIIYAFVNKFGIRFIDKLIGKEKLSEVSFLNHTQRLDYLVFIAFFIPGTPKDIITYFMPLTNMKLSKFLIISSLARIPSVISSTIGGNALGMEQYEFTIFVFVVTALFSLVGLYLYKVKIHSLNHYSKTNL